jgi:predicted CXXCH cytochrome family protein
VNLRAAFAAVAAAALMWGEAFGQERTDPAAAFKDDVHAAAGLTCVSCHAQGSGSGGYDTPARTAIAPLCAKCHSDAAYMQKFDPQVRVDQFLQYQTSVHGKRMAGGDERVATCSDCHGTHGVKRIRDARAPVAPLNVTATCARCHGDEARMKPYGRDAAPPTDWAASVHATALLERGDTSAPTCAACHGSHGATPPGVASVANVCSQCHVREAELFRASPKREIFDAIGQPECLVCHSNHRIRPPADTWVGLAEPAVCAQCHDDASGGAAAIREVRRGLDRVAATISSAEATLLRAEQAGMLVDDGRGALREARQHHIQSRVLVHAFAVPPFSGHVQQGLASAEQASRVGEQALRDLQTRRRGLAVATLVILGFLATLGWKIRSLPEPPPIQRP